MRASDIAELEMKLWMQQDRWFKRPNIRWAFGAKAYENATFGSRIGPTHSLIEAGLHELAHCIDFVMLGRINRISYNALTFVAPWINAIFINGRVYNDFPQTSRATWCEIRTNVIQAIMMQQGFGTCYRTDYGVDSEFLIECSIEERFRKEAKAGWSFDDAATFHTEEGRHKSIEQCYYDAYMRMYQCLNTPFGLKRISNALDRVNTHMGKLIEQAETQTLALASPSSTACITRVKAGF